MTTEVWVNPAVAIGVVDTPSIERFEKAIAATPPTKAISVKERIALWLKEALAESTEVLFLLIIVPKHKEANSFWLKSIKLSQAKQLNWMDLTQSTLLNRFDFWGNEFRLSKEWDHSLPFSDDHYGPQFAYFSIVNAIRSFNWVANADNVGGHQSAIGWINGMRNSSLP